MKLCARRECCSGQIILKLKKTTLTEEEQSMILTRLLKERYVDDTRFAEIYCRDKALNARWGWNKILQQLKQWNLGDVQAKALAVWKELNPNNTHLTELAASKWKQIPRHLPTDKRCARLSRFLLGRGFAIHDVIEVVRPYFGNP
jgi:regulatory protein